MYGQYRHTLDAKGRLFVPSKLREELGASFYITPSPDPCLTIYPEKEWERVMAHYNELPFSKTRGMRYFMANVMHCEPDKQGRFLLPERLREFGGITQDVVFIGLAGHAELWAAERYLPQESEHLTPEMLAVMMEDMGF